MSEKSNEQKEEKGTWSDEREKREGLFI